MGVEPKIGFYFRPQIIHFNRVFHYKSSIFWYHQFWKHPHHHHRHRHRHPHHHHHPHRRHHRHRPRQSMSINHPATALLSAWPWSTCGYLASLYICICHRLSAKQGSLTSFHPRAHLFGDNKNSKWLQMASYICVKPATQNIRTRFVQFPILGYMATSIL